MTTKTMILSPHCDDIPLSLGATLLAQSLQGEIVVCVVFSQSRYTKFEKGDADLSKTTALRHQEELAAGQRAGYRTRFLPFPEPFARPGFRNRSEIFDMERRPENESVWEAVKTSYKEIFEDSTNIISPLGCGGHIDHRIVTSSFRQFVQHNNRMLPMFYEDLPYAANLDLERIAEMVPLAWQHHRFIPVVLGQGYLEAKLELLTVYESQLEDSYLTAVRKQWARRGGEVLWLPEGYENQIVFH